MHQNFDLHSEDFIVDNLIEKRKRFFLEETNLYITKDHFKREEGFLFDLHMKSTATKKAKVVEEIKKEIIDANKEQLVRKASPLDELVLKIPKTLVPKIQTSIHYWLHLGKEANYFKYLSQSILNNIPKSLCLMCLSSEKLQVIEVFPLTTIINKLQNLK